MDLLRAKDGPSNGGDLQKTSTVIDHVPGRKVVQIEMLRMNTNKFNAIGILFRSSETCFALGWRRKVLLLHQQAKCRPVLTTFVLLLFCLLPLRLTRAQPQIECWARSYGGSDWEWPRSIEQTSDGGYAVAGYTYSFGAGNRDFWVLKLDGDGTIQWQKTYGGADWDGARSIEQTSDGGYVVAGRTESFGAGRADFWVLKLDGDGNIPECNIVRNSVAITTETTVTDVDSNATPFDSDATVTITSIDPTDSNALVNTQCYLNMNKIYLPIVVKGR
jgi:hypothetical protein